MLTQRDILFFEQIIQVNKETTKVPYHCMTRCERISFTRRQLWEKHVIYSCWGILKAAIKIGSVHIRDKCLAILWAWGFILGIRWLVQLMMICTDPCDQPFSGKLCFSHLMRQYFGIWDWFSIHDNGVECISAIKQITPLFKTNLLQGD